MCFETSGILLLTKFAVAVFASNHAYTMYYHNMNFLYWYHDDELYIDISVCIDIPVYLALAYCTSASDLEQLYI